MNNKRGVEGMKRERWIVHIKIDGCTIARGKKGSRFNSRRIKKSWHREMRANNKRMIREEV